MEFDINTIKKYFEKDQFCLDFYRHIYPDVIREDFPADVDGERIIFGKRNGIEIIRFDAGKADASFQFRCTYSHRIRLENMAYTKIDLLDKAQIYPVTTVVVKEEATATTEKIVRDMGNFYKANVLVLMKWNGSKREWEDFGRTLNNRGIDILLTEEIEKINTHVINERLLIF